MPSYLTPGVYVEEIPAQSKPIEGVGTSVAAFVGLAPGGPVNKPMRISNWTQFAKLYGDPNEPENGPFMPGAYLAHSVYGFFQNGGGVCWIVRVGAAEGAQQAQAALPAATGDGELFRATAREGVTDQVTIAITPEPATGDGEEGKADQATYRVVISAGPQHEEFDGLSLKKGRSNVATKVNAGSQLVTLEEVGSAADAAPREGTYTLSVPAAEPVAVGPGEFEGDVAHRRGLGGLAAVDEITMLCIPDLVTIAQSGDDTMFRDIQGKMLAHAEGGEGPDRDPRPAARPAAAGRARVEDEHGRLRLEVRHPVLPVARGDGPAHAAADHGAAVGPHGGRLGAHRQHPRRAQGAGERGRARGERARLPDHARGAGRPEPARASTASARSRAAASACGAPARSRAIPSGAT